jgi:hypothetical protein
MAPLIVARRNDGAPRGGAGSVVGWLGLLAAMAPNNNPNNHPNGGYAPGRHMGPASMPPLLGMDSGGAACCLRFRL